MYIEFIIIINKNLCLFRSSFDPQISIYNENNDKKARKKQYIKHKTKSGKV